jgi:hypothetical protein
MKNLLQLEILAEFLFSIFLFSTLDFAWWLYPVLFIAPDLSLLVLFAGQRIGAVLYNLVHHKAVCLGLFAAGALLGYPALALAGSVMLGHSSLDRLMGYGLMVGDTFTHAHLKLAGQKARRSA